MKPKPPWRTERALTRRGFLGRAALTTSALAGPWSSWRRAYAQGDVGADDQRKIEAALPAEAFVRSRKPRKLLIFDLNVGYGGHGSISTANLAFTLMGRKTGAFETVVSRDPAVFEPESLRQFDAVFFNNTVGNCFADPALRQSLVEFVYGGGGLMGVHGTSVAFTQWPGAIEDWPEFGLMIGARGANHRASDERVFVKLDDAAHPVNQPFGGQGFEYRDEFFRVHEPYSRDRVRVLLSIDTEKTDLKQGPAYGKLERADNDFALAWLRNYGRGRTFYCTIAHNPYVFWNAKMLQFYLAATQFVLGDLEAPTLPSAKLTPAMRAQEKLGWRLVIQPDTFCEPTLFETIDKTAQLGVPYLGGVCLQTVSTDIRKSLDNLLSDGELEQLRTKFDGAGVRMLTYDDGGVPQDAAGYRRVFESARRLGVESLVLRPRLEDFDLVERLCDEFEVNLAIPVFPRPDQLQKACEGRSRHLGASFNLDSWLGSGIDPLPALRTLRDRLMIVNLHDADKKGEHGKTVPWGTGIGRVGECLRELHRLGVRPVTFGLRYPHGYVERTAEIARCIEFFNQTCLKLAEEKSK